MMRTILLFLTFSISLAGCGGGSNNGSDPVRPGGPGGDDGGKLTGNHYSDILRLNGEPISITKFPSTTFDGVVAACKKGQSYFMDQCYDKLNIGDKAVVGLKSGTTNINDIAGFDGWKTSMIKVDIQSYKNQQRFTCRTGLCGDPTFYDGIVEFSATRLSEFYVNTYFMFGRGEDVNVVHQWFLDGTAELNGRSYDFPLTIADVNEAYGIFIDPFAAFYEQETDWGYLRFRIEDDAFNTGTGDLVMPTNPLDKRVIGIKYVFSDTN